jgi:hypothetical protein
MALEGPLFGGLITPSEMVSSTSLQALSSSQVPLGAAATRYVFGYDARSVLITGTSASDCPNGDESIASIECAG